MRSSPLLLSIVVLVSHGCSAGGRADAGSGATATLTSGDSVTTSGTSGGGTTTTTGLIKLDLPKDVDLPDATSGECVAETLAPETKSLAVDILVVVDTSGSMAEAIAAVETSINVDFAAILEDSGVDYRIIVLGDYPPGVELWICVTEPLSTTNCMPPPTVPAVTERYKHYDAPTGSSDFLTNVLAWYTAPDPHNLAPGGYRDLLRDGARKVFLGITDGNSGSDDPADGESLDAGLLALQPPHFGTPGDRRYVFHTIITMAPNEPPNMPWLPGDPIQGEGGALQHVSVLSGGWRFPLSEVAYYDVLFQEIAKDVVDTTPIACSFPIPDPPMGTIDPDTIQIDYRPGGVGPVQSFHQVADLASCESDAFYVTGGTVVLCPLACTKVQADLEAALEVRYGCDVGYVPPG